MSQVKPIPVEHLDALIDIASKAFPGMGITTEEARERFKRRLISSYDQVDHALYGLYREDVLLGGMIIYDFTMNVFGNMTPVGGVGLVVVSLLHKREHVAKELISYFMSHYRAKQTPLLALYPFRPDFYKRMGFGYGTKKNQYRIRPNAFPRYGEKSNIRFLNPDDAPKVLDCYNRYAKKKHGMILASKRIIDTYFSDRSRSVVGYLVNGELQGYLMFKFDRLEDYPIQELLIQEFIYETRAAMVELLAFLHTQYDQISRIVYNTHDDSFHYLLDDPRNDSHQIIHPIHHVTNTQGIGLMYRIIDVRRFFDLIGNRNFGGMSCRVKFTIIDSFLPENAGEIIIHFKDGQAYFDRESFDVAVEIDISDFSSMIMGTVSFKKLYEYNRAQITDPAYIGTITSLFRCDEPPVCLAFF